MPAQVRHGIILFAVIAGFAWVGPAPAQEAGRIARVVLYPGSATIERSARIAAGSGTVEMTGLPANFDLRTLRVEADPGIRVGEVSVQDVARAEAVSGRESELESRIQALKDEKAALDVEVKTAELVRNYLAALSTRPAPEGEYKPQPVVVDPKAIPAVIEAIRRGGTDAYGLIQRIEIKKRGIDKQIAVLERDLARLRSGARDVRTLAISYSASRAGEVRAAYQVTNAGWKPAYRATLDSSASRIDLERQAAVMQRSGEDWRGVTLRLSTGQPRAAHIVDPTTWQLVIRPPVDARDSASRLQSAPAAPEPRAIARSDARAEEAPIIAQFETQYATEFEVPGKVDLPADGRQISVSLASQSIPVKQRIRIVPRRDTAAMVTAEAELPEGVWIPGNVQLYRDGSYIGSTFWQAQAKERLVLPFGRDDRVQVTANRTKNRSGAAGLLGGRSERQIADLYTITSRHKVPVELLVLEASPVAVSDQIAVDAVFEPQPKIRDWEHRRGVVAWEQSLAPGETRKFIADYTITYPKDASVIGLP
jgi:uncharacterized protein (TIGR02231 family)